MRNMTRRGLLGLGAGAAAAAGLAGCGAGGKSAVGSKEKGSQGAGATPKKGPVRLIGDGSTADTGLQPNQPSKPVRMEPGRPRPSSSFSPGTGRARSATVFSRDS